MPQTSLEPLSPPIQETGNQSKTFLQRYLIGTIKAFLGFTHPARSSGNNKRQHENVIVQESERLPSQNIANVIGNLNNSEASLSRSGGDYGSQSEAPVILPISHSSFGEGPRQTIVQAGKHETRVSKGIKLRADSSERLEHSIDSRMQPTERTSSKQNSMDLPIESKEGQHSNPISDARVLDTAVMSKSTMNSPVDRSPALQANEKQHPEIASAVNSSQRDESNLIVTSPTTPGSATIDSASLTPSAQRSHSLPDDKLHAFTTTERPRLQPRHSHTVPTNSASSDEDFGAYGGSRERVLGGDEEKESLSSQIQQSSGAPTRPHVVPDITGRVKKTTKLPIFEGTYSNVYKGEFEGLKVAIKDLRTVKNAQAMQRKLRREVETWWHLTHENILPLLGYIQDDEYGPYGALVSPWCEHGDAGVFLTRKQTPRQRVSMFQDVSLGIQYLHSFYPTIVHGDLKPTNVLIDENLTAKLCDFGLVRLIQDEMVTGMTTTAYTGTTRYLSYELVASEEEALPTTASDIYALACLGMEFIYSHPPYAHIHPNTPRAPLKICREIEIGKPPAHRPIDIDGALSDLWDLFEACWDLDATKRPTADDVCAFLERSGQSIIDHLEQ